MFTVKVECNVEFILEIWLCYKEGFFCMENLYKCYVGYGYVRVGW